MITKPERVYWGCTTNGCSYGDGLHMARKWKFCPLCGSALSEITEPVTVKSWAAS